MRKKFIAIGSIAAIAITSIGGMVFAQSTNRVLPSEPETRAIVRNINSGRTIQDNNIPEVNIEDQATNNGEYVNKVNNEYGYGNVINMMMENGFKDMAKYMEDGNFEAMYDWMTNMNDEDYSKMVNIMEQNGYSHMSRMMDVRNEHGYGHGHRSGTEDVIGRENTVQMHNSMMGTSGGRMGGMMGRNR